MLCFRLSTKPSQVAARAQVSRSLASAALQWYNTLCEMRASLQACKSTCVNVLSSEGTLQLHHGRAMPQTSLKLLPSSAAVHPDMLQQGSPLTVQCSRLRRRRRPSPFCCEVQHQSGAKHPASSPPPGPMLHWPGARPAITNCGKLPCDQTRHSHMSSASSHS